MPPTPEHRNSLRQEAVARICRVLTNPSIDLTKSKREQLLLQLAELGSYLCLDSQEAQ